MRGNEPSARSEGPRSVLRPVTAATDDCPAHRNQGRHRRRRHRGRQRRVPSHEARLQGRRAAGAKQTRRRHDLACRRHGRPIAHDQQHDEDQPGQRRFVRRSGTGDRPLRRLEAGGQRHRRQIARAHEAALPHLRDGRADGSRSAHHHGRGSSVALAAPAHGRPAWRRVAATRRQGHPQGSADRTHESSRAAGSASL